MSQPVRKNGFAEFRCDERSYDLGRWSSVFAELNALDCPVVVDTRNAGFHLSEIDAYLLVLETEGLANLARHGIAFVSGKPGDGAALRFLVNCARSRQLKMALFDDMRRNQHDLGAVAQRWAGIEIDKSDPYRLVRSSRSGLPSENESADQLSR